MEFAVVDLIILESSTNISVNTFVRLILCRQMYNAVLPVFLDFVSQKCSSTSCAGVVFTTPSLGGQDHVVGTGP